MGVENSLPKLVRGALSGDTRIIHASTLTIIRQLKASHPTVAGELAKILAYDGVGASTIRSVGLDSAPRDNESHLELVNIEEFEEDMSPPIFGSELHEQIERFFRERSKMDELIAQGLRPSTNLLLVGPPGVGKTYLSQYMACRLHLPLVTLDLASVVSSYLGKTGQNIKRVFDYVRGNKAVLLLDEFDAVAKRRNDESDLGELKRIVNVLLKELENWPVDSLVIAATNHPELLDKAIWRRFDHVLEIGFPDSNARLQILRRAVGELVDADFLSIMAKVTENLSGADLTSLCDRIVRRVIIDSENIIQATISELRSSLPDTHRFNGVFIRSAKRTLGDKVVQKDLAKWLGITPATVSHHMKGE